MTMTAAKKPRRTARRPRPLGSGSLRSVRDGVWRIEVETHRDSETGKRRRTSRYIYGAREEAELALARLRVNASQQRQPVRPSTRKSMRAAFDFYLNEAKAGTIHLAPKTLVTSRSAARAMCRQRISNGRLFSDIRPEMLTWEDIEDLYTTMQRNGLGPDWIRRSATVLNRTLDYAKKRKLIDSNPCHDATRPRTVRKKPYSPTRDEVDALMDAVRTYERSDGSVDEELADALEVFKGTGMRKGEFLGLWVEDLDFKNAEIHIAWAIGDGGPGVGVVRMPTKRADWRDVPMTDSVLLAFERQLARRKALTGEYPGAREYVFPRNYQGSEPTRPDSFSDRLIEARGTSRITFQDLRHYVATTMLDAGISYRTVADLLGNSEATLRLHYDGRTDTGKRSALDTLETGEPAALRLIS